MGDGKGARSHYPSKEAMQAGLANEIDEVGGQPEGHAARLAFKVGSLDLFHRLASEDLRQFVAGLEPRIAETESTCAFAEAHGGQGLELCLVEGVGEEGVRSMVRCEPLLEQEKVVNIVKDPVEIRREQARLHKTCVLTEVWSCAFSYHCLKVVFVELLDLWAPNRREALLLAFTPAVK